MKCPICESQTIEAYADEIVDRILDAAESLEALALRVCVELDVHTAHADATPQAREILQCQVLRVVEERRRARLGLSMANIGRALTVEQRHLIDDWFATRSEDSRR